MKLRFGWVEVYRGSNEDECRNLERALHEAAIRCRVCEYEQTGKPSTVSMQSMAHNTSAGRGTSFNLNSAFPVYSDTTPVYMLQIKRRDMEKFQDLRRD